MNQFTSKKGTQTREGFINHKKIKNGLRLPVKIDFNSEKIDDLFLPLRKNR